MVKISYFGYIILIITVISGVLGSNMTAELFGNYDIEKVDCYDNRYNIINGLTCERKIINPDIYDYIISFSISFIMLILFGIMIIGKDFYKLFFD